MSFITFVHTLRRQRERRKGLPYDIEEERKLLQRIREEKYHSEVEESQTRGREQSTVGLYHPYET